MRRRGFAGGLLLLLLLSFVPDPGWGQSASPAVAHRRVARDSDTRVGWVANFQRFGDDHCSARFIPKLDLVVPPANGVVRFVAADLGVLPHTGCNNSVYGIAIMYRPGQGFVGQDQFTIVRPDDPMAQDQIGPPARKITFVIRVLDSAPAGGGAPR